MRAVLYDDEQRVGGARERFFTYNRSRPTNDTARPLNFQKDDERGVCEKLIRFESILHPSLSHPSLQYVVAYPDSPHFDPAEMGSGFGRIRLR